MVELLKQPQYQPFTVEEQIISIFAGTQGYLDELPVSGVAEFEAALLKCFRDEFPELLEELRTTGTLPDELSEKLRKVIADFKSHFVGEGA